jgi:hypothetical protein
VVAKISIEMIVTVQKALKKIRGCKKMGESFTKKFKI